MDSLTFSSGVSITDSLTPLTVSPLFVLSGKRVSELCARGYEDVILPVLYRPGGVEALQELLSQRHAWLPGQSGRPGHRME